MKQDVNIQFAIKNLKMKKRVKKNLTSSGEDLNPGFLSILKHFEDVQDNMCFDALKNHKTCTVKVVDKEQFDKEQIGVKDKEQFQSEQKFPYH